MDNATWISTYAIWISCFIIWGTVYYQEKKRKNAVKQYIKRKKNNRKGAEEMKKAIELYLGKPVQVTTIEGSEYGRLVTYEDDWLTLDYKGKVVRISDEYVITIRDYKLPVDKKNK